MKIAQNVRPAALAAAGLLSLPLVAAAQPPVYHRTNLVSDGTIPALHTDPNLVNAWGVAFNPMGFVWVADADAGKSTLYDGNGVPQSLIVDIPAPGGGGGAGSPTGIVFSGGADLIVNGPNGSGPARFIFATEEGSLAAWNPQADVTHAITVATSTDDANYKGLAIATFNGASRLFATDFHNGKVDIFDGAFQPVTIEHAFEDNRLPRGFAPFGIQTIGRVVYVTYAMQDEDREDEVTGPGLGAVDAFSMDGRLLARVARGGPLNAPWGIALAPDDFGHHSNQLLIGNFGDGRINAYDSRRHFRGQLQGENHRPIEIDGLWGMQFGNGLNDQPTNTLFFASGPDDEEHGLYGRLDPEPRHGHGGGGGH